MGIPLKKLLYTYFGIEELKSALEDIGEPLSGNKDELVNRLIANWEQHNRDIYDLLDYLDKGMLSTLCADYNLDDSGDIDLLKRRIKRNKLLGNSNSLKPKTQVAISDVKTSYKQLESRENTISHNRSRRSWLKTIYVVAGIVGTIITILTYFGIRP